MKSKIVLVSCAPCEPNRLYLRAGLREAQAAGIKFTHRPEIMFSPRRGDSLHRFTLNLARPTGTCVRLAKLAAQNFTSIGAGNGNAAAKIQKFPLFGWVASQGRTLWPISRNMGYYTTNYPALVFQIWSDLLHRLRSYCWETARRSIRPNFSVHPVWKTMRLGFLAGWCVSPKNHYW